MKHTNDTTTPRRTSGRRLRRLALTAAGAGIAIGGLGLGLGPSPASAASNVCDPFVSTPSGYSCEDTDTVTFGINTNSNAGNEIYVEVRAHWYLKAGTQDQWRLGIERAKLCVKDDQFARAQATLQVHQRDGATALSRSREVTVTGGDLDFSDTCTSLVPSPQSGNLYFEVADPAGTTSLDFLRVSIQRENVESGASIGTVVRKTLVPEGD